MIENSILEPCDSPTDFDFLVGYFQPLQGRVLKFFEAIHKYFEGSSC